MPLKRGGNWQYGNRIRWKATARTVEAGARGAGAAPDGVLPRRLGEQGASPPVVSRARCMRDGGRSDGDGQVDPALLASAEEAFATTLRPAAGEPGKVFAADFGSRKMSKEMVILDMPERNLVPAWENCVRNATDEILALWRTCGRG